MRHVKTWQIWQLVNWLINLDNRKQIWLYTRLPLRLSVIKWLISPEQWRATSLPCLSNIRKLDFLAGPSTNRTRSRWLPYSLSAINQNCSGYFKQIWMAWAASFVAVSLASWIFYEMRTKYIDRANTQLRTVNDMIMYFLGTFTSQGITCSS